MKKLKAYQVNEKVLVPMIKFVVNNPKDAKRFIEIINPCGIVDMVSVGGRR